MKPTGSIATIIAELQNKRDEIDRAIADLMKIANSGLLEATVSPKGVRVVANDKSAYELAVDVLKAEKSPLVMKELVGRILQAGYTSRSQKPFEIINTSLYKAIANKKRCEIVICKDGRIGLKG